MSASQVIQAALSAGVHIATDGQQIIITAKEKPADTLLADLRQYRLEIITELEHLQRLWLARVASLLSMTPAQLLQPRYVEPCDMQELWHTEPIHAARLINSCWPAQARNPPP